MNTAMTALFYLFVIISAINVVHFGFFLIGANYYDFLQFKKGSKKLKVSRQPRPLISILIPAHNEEKSIIRCLDSVRTNTYRKLEIIVIDDASKDNTRKLVRAYIKQHPNRAIRLMYKRKNAGKAGALNHALRRGAKGSLIMTVDADSVLGKRSITSAVNHFNDSSVVGVAANVRVMESKSILGLLQRFEYMVGYRSKKFFSVTNSEFIIGGVASTYRADTLKKVGFYDHDILTEDIALSLKVVAQGNKANRVIYGFDVIAMTEGVQTFKALMKQRYRWKMGSLQTIVKYRKLVGNRSGDYSRMLVWYRLPMAFMGEMLLIAEPFILMYVLFLCLQVMSLSFFAGAYLTITLYLLWNVLPDEHMSLKNKLKLSAYAPVMYFVMYLMNIVQVVAIFRCLLHPFQILRKANTTSSWVSPERAGQTQVQFT